MDELMISGKRYISSRRAAKEFKYHADYIGQLIRGGKLDGQKVGRTWYVSAASLGAHLGKEASKEEKATPPPGLQHPEPLLPPPTPAQTSVVPVSALPIPAQPPTEQAAVPARELKMLTYLTEKEKDASELPVVLKKEFKFEPNQADTVLLKREDVRLPSSSGELESAEPSSDEEVPVAFRVTSKLPTHISNPPAVVAPESQLYYPYAPREGVSVGLVDPRRARRVAGAIIVLILFGALSLAGGFFVSSLPKVEQVSY